MTSPHLFDRRDALDAAVALAKIDNDGSPQTPDEVLAAAEKFLGFLEKETRT